MVDINPELIEKAKNIFNDNKPEINIARKPMVDMICFGITSKNNKSKPFLKFQIKHNVFYPIYKTDIPIIGTIDVDLIGMQYEESSVYGRKLEIAFSEFVDYLYQTVELGDIIILRTYYEDEIGKENEFGVRVGVSDLWELINKDYDENGLYATINDIIIRNDEYKSLAKFTWNIDEFNESVFGVDYYGIVTTVEKNITKTEQLRVESVDIIKLMQQINIPIDLTVFQNKKFTDILSTDRNDGFGFIKSKFMNLFISAWLWNKLKDNNSSNKEFDMKIFHENINEIFKNDNFIGMQEQLKRKTSLLNTVYEAEFSFDIIDNDKNIHDKIHMITLLVNPIVIANLIFKYVFENSGVSDMIVPSIFMNDKFVKEILEEVNTERFIVPFTSVTLYFRYPDNVKVIGNPDLEREKIRDYLMFMTVNHIVNPFYYGASINPDFKTLPFRYVFVPELKNFEIDNVTFHVNQRLNRIFQISQYSEQDTDMFTQFMWFVNQHNKIKFINFFEAINGNNIHIRSSPLKKSNDARDVYLSIPLSQLIYYSYSLYTNQFMYGNVFRGDFDRSDIKGFKSFGYMNSISQSSWFTNFVKIYDGKVHFSFVPLLTPHYIRKKNLFSLFKKDNNIFREITTDDIMELSFHRLEKNQKVLSITNIDDTTVKPNIKPMLTIYKLTNVLKEDDFVDTNFTQTIMNSAIMTIDMNKYHTEIISKIGYVVETMYDVATVDKEPFMIINSYKVDTNVMLPFVKKENNEYQVLYDMDINAIKSTYYTASGTLKSRSNLAVYTVPIDNAFDKTNAKSLFKSNTAIFDVRNYQTKETKSGYKGMKIKFEDIHTSKYKQENFSGSTNIRDFYPIPIPYYDVKNIVDKKQLTASEYHKNMKWHVPTLKNGKSLRDVAKNYVPFYLEMKLFNFSIISNKKTKNSFTFRIPLLMYMPIEIYSYSRMTAMIKETFENGFIPQDIIDDIRFSEWDNRGNMNTYNVIEMFTRLLNGTVTERFPYTYMAIPDIDYLLELFANDNFMHVMFLGGLNRIEDKDIKLSARHSDEDARKRTPLNGEKARRLFFDEIFNELLNMFKYPIIISSKKALKGRYNMENDKFIYLGGTTVKLNFSVEMMSYDDLKKEFKKFKKAMIYDFNKIFRKLDFTFKILYAYDTFIKSVLRKNYVNGNVYIPNKGGDKFRVGEAVKLYDFRKLSTSYLSHNLFNDFLSLNFEGKIELAKKTMELLLDKLDSDGFEYDHDRLVFNKSETLQLGEIVKSNYYVWKVVTYIGDSTGGGGGTTGFTQKIYLSKDSVAFVGNYEEEDFISKLVIRLFGLEYNSFNNLMI